MLNLVNGTPLTGLEYVEHLERGYCANHPDVVAGTKAQVVDRAVKQLLTLLQGVKCEITEDTDGIILNLGYTAQGGTPNGLIRVTKADSKLQYYDIASTSWKDFGGGIADHTLLQNIGENSHETIDNHLANNWIHDPTGYGSILSVSSTTELTGDQCRNGRIIFVEQACTVTLGFVPDSGRLTIFPRGVQATLTYAPGMGGIILPGTTTPATVRNTSAAWGDCIVLRSWCLSMDAWLVESLIGTWAAV